MPADDPRLSFGEPSHTDPPTTDQPSAAPRRGGPFRAGVSPAAQEVPVPACSGYLVNGRYRLVERLGSGGMGTVWRGVDEVINRTVAVKEPGPLQQLTAAERAVIYERMRREAKAAAGIAHPNVVGIFDVAIDNGRPWIVMELVPGRTLADELSEGRQRPERAASVCLGVLEALEAAHRAGIVHRDVKPANVLLAPDGRVVLTDFGIARIEGEQPLTTARAIIGSPEYMAPERVDGHRPEPASDLWSLGVVLFECVEGWSPFRRGTSLSTLVAVREEELHAPRHAGPLAKLITSLLCKNPAKRPDHATVRRALRAAALDATAEGSESTAAGPRPWWRRGRNQVIGGGAVALVAASAVLFTVLTQGAGGLPDGYRRYDEPKMHLNIALPKSYHRHDVQMQKDYQRTYYTEPGGAITFAILRVKDESDAVIAAEKEMAHYKSEEGDHSTGDMHQVSTTRVGDTYRLHGSRTGTIDFTFRSWNAETRSDDPTVQRRMETYVIGRDGWTYDLFATFPAHGQSGKDGVAAYTTIRDHIRIDGL